MSKGHGRKSVCPSKLIVTINSIKKDENILTSLMLVTLPQTIKLILSQRELKV